MLKKLVRHVITSRKDSYLSSVNNNITITKVVLDKIVQLDLNSYFTNVVFILKLVSYTRDLLVVTRINNNNIQLLRQKQKALINVTNVIKKVINIALILILDTLILTYFYKIIYLSNIYFLNREKFREVFRYFFQIQVVISAIYIQLILITLLQSIYINIPLINAILVNFYIKLTFKIVSILNYLKLLKRFIKVLEVLLVFIIKRSSSFLFLIIQIILINRYIRVQILEVIKISLLLVSSYTRVKLSIIIVVI